MAGGSGDGQIMRPNYPPGFHIPVMDPHQVQYIQKMSNHGKDSARVAGNSSQGLHFHGPDNLQSLEKAYLEALLLQQYQSQLLQKPGNINHQYHGNPAFSPYLASFQGNPLLSSQNSRESLRNSMIQNEKCVQIPLNLESLKGDSTGSLHSQGGSSAKGRFESLIEMVKNNKAKSLELSDILGHVIEFRYEGAGAVTLFCFIMLMLETSFMFMFICSSFYIQYGSVWKSLHSAEAGDSYS